MKNSIKLTGYKIGHVFNVQCDTFLWTCRYHAGRRRRVDIPAFVKANAPILVLDYVHGAVYGKNLDTGDMGWLG